ncbi:MAG: type II toxin-antitoxin system VapC family toxin [Blastocatellia bacterium]
MIILDTDCLSLMNRERILEATKLQKALDSIRPEEIFTTIITYEEQMRGWLAFLARCKSLDEEIYAYNRLHIFLESYRNTQVLDFDEKAVKAYKQLKTQKIRIGTMDLSIAAVAISNKAILISGNLKDFTKVPGLAVQDWT